MWKVRNWRHLIKKRLKTEEEDEGTENERKVNQWMIDDVVENVVEDGIKTKRKRRR